jgi:hypothetical protein
MSAEHVDDPHAALEARVAKLEELVQHQLPGKVDAVGWAVGLLHHDLRALREQTESRFDKVDERLGKVDGRLDGIDGRLDRHGELLGQHTDMLRDLGGKLDELLRRLPGTQGEDSATTR